MPGLVVFNRRWSIGSDDLPVPAMILVFLNSVWVIALVSMVIEVHMTDGWRGDCSGGFLWYPIMTIGLLALLTVNDVFIAVQSAKGGVFDKKARHNIPVLLYIRTALLVVETIWACSGCVLLNWKLRTSQCDSSDLVYTLLCVVVGSNMVVIFFTLLTLYMSFDSAGRTFTKFQNLQQNSADNSTSSEPTLSVETRQEILSRKLRDLHEEKWTSRVTAGFCCAALRKPSDKAVFNKIAILLADYFDNLDVVLSDFIAGMFLLRKQQKSAHADTVQQPTNDIYQYLSGMAISPRTKFLTLKDENMQSEFTCMLHFAEYALAAYGYQGQYFFYPAKACCRINICGRCRGCPSRQDERILVGDNCCQCQYAAITTCSPLSSEDDFIYGNYENKPNFPSYFVCLDHTYKKVVLCIRGTLSIRDALIDLQGDSTKLDDIHPSWKGHRGMVAAADNIFAELTEHQILESAFDRCPTSGYSLLVTGHSLGAGVAPIISFRLREKYPHLYCYAFSPPGGLLSLDAMNESREFTTSIVVGKDIIPRLGLPQLEYFRSDILSLLENSSTPKWRIFTSTLPLLGRCLEYQNTADLPISRSQNYSPFFTRTLSSTHEPMFMPGRVLHIVKNYPREKPKGSPLYQAVWADNSSFDTIIVSPSMLEDHLPNNVLEAMQKVVENHGPKKPEKMLSEEERRATLRCGDGEVISTGTDLSWEYTCQMEATVALGNSIEEDFKSNSLQMLLNEEAKPPTQSLSAPLASEEDLLSVQHSTYSISSQKGFSGIDCRLHSLLESSNRTHPALSRSKSASECVRTQTNQTCNHTQGEGRVWSPQQPNHSSTSVIIPLTTRTSDEAYQLSSYQHNQQEEPISDSAYTSHSASSNCSHSKTHSPTDPQLPVSPISCVTSC